MLSVIYITFIFLGVFMFDVYPGHIHIEFQVSTTMATKLAGDGEGQREKG